MRDFPFFTTDFGVASLVLREIPYKKEAYICVRDVQPGMLPDLLAECISFCKMAGAQQIYASGHDGLSLYPLFMTVLQMRGQVTTFRESTVCLFPVTEKTVGAWRELYNQKMKSVHNSRTLEKRDEKQLLESSGVYFVHEGGVLQGIGWVEDSKLLAIASAVPGAGEKVLTALMDLVPEEHMTLEVASDNIAAIRLYERMGFLKTGEVSRWYDVT